MGINQQVNQRNNRIRPASGTIQHPLLVYTYIMYDEGLYWGSTLSCIPSTFELLEKQPVKDHREISRVIKGTALSYQPYDRWPSPCPMPMSLMKKQLGFCKTTKGDGCMDGKRDNDIIFIRE